MVGFSWLDGLAWLDGKVVEKDANDFNWRCGFVISENFGVSKRGLLIFGLIREKLRIIGTDGKVWRSWEYLEILLFRKFFTETSNSEVWLA